MGMCLQGGNLKLQMGQIFLYFSEIKDCGHIQMYFWPSKGCPCKNQSQGQGVKKITEPELSHNIQWDFFPQFVRYISCKGKLFPSKLRQNSNFCNFLTNCQVFSYPQQFLPQMDGQTLPFAIQITEPKISYRIFRDQFSHFLRYIS